MTHSISAPAAPQLARKGIHIAVRNRKDFLSGVLFLIAGGAFAAVAAQYDMGTAAEMGSGYVPFFLGVLLALIGLWVAASAVSRAAVEEPLPRWNVRALLWVLGSTALSGFLFEKAGVVLSLLLLIVLASRASAEFTWRGTLTNAFVITGFNLVTFVWLLKLQIPVWPAFLAG